MTTPEEPKELIPPASPGEPPRLPPGELPVVPPLPGEAGREAATDD